MANLTLRVNKGSPLTHTEADANLTEIERRTGLGWCDNIIEMTTRSGPSEPQMSEFRDGIHLLTFPHENPTQGVNIEVFGSFHINHDYALGTALYPHIHWTTDSATLGTVRWAFEYTFAKGHQQQAFPATTTIYIEQTSLGIPYMHYVAEVSDAFAIPGTGIETDGILLSRVYRDVEHPNDTFNDQVFGICLDLHYQVDHATTPFKRPDFFTP